MKALYKDEPRTVYTRKALPFEDFVAALKADEPSELFVGPYSNTKPMFLVSKYYPEAISFSCQALADKSERCMSYAAFYDFVSNERSEMYYN